MYLGCKCQHDYNITDQVRYQVGLRLLCQHDYNITDQVGIRLQCEHAYNITDQVSIWHENWGEEGQKGWCRGRKLKVKKKLKICPGMLKSCRNYNQNSMLDLGCHYNMIST